MGAPSRTASGSTSGDRTRADDLLGPDGPLASRWADYEPRDGQLEMARAVQDALERDEVLLCEAGTGTGKTLAYLVPAILSGKKVIVSTATRALQEQIYARDLPLIRRTLGLEPHAALMKGLGNYVCLRRYEQVRAGAVTLPASVAPALDVVQSWLHRTETGDIAELAELAETDSIWHELTASPDTRLGQTCSSYGACFVTRMKRAAEAARLVIVNHHLFFADLALRGAHPGRVLPDYDAVIFDEAHGLEDIATDFFGVQVSPGRIERAGRDAERALSVLRAADPGLVDETSLRHPTELREASAGFWEQLRQEVGQREVRTTVAREIWTGKLAGLWHRLDAALEALAGAASAARARAGEQRARGSDARLGAATLDALESGERRLETLRDQLAAVVESAPGRVCWIELGARSSRLSSSPVDVSAIFRERIFEAIPAVVLTSATLATACSPRESVTELSAPSRPTGPFGYLRARLGIEEAGREVAETVVSSPFEFSERALLYTPRDLPPPKSSDFLDAATERIAALVEITGGGAFVLTTSLRSMHGLARRLRERAAPARVLVQGELPKSALLDEFRRAEDAILVATMSFWEGVDVPGRSLRLVVLEKLPFFVPTDPIVQARSLAIEEAGGNPFMELHLPAAAITLKQGFGRLIRTRHDFGVVALLDERVHRRGYGMKLLASLPPAARTTELSRVRNFWRARASASVSDQQ